MHKCVFEYTVNLTRHDEVLQRDVQYMYMVQHAEMRHLHLDNIIFLFLMLCQKFWGSDKHKMFTFFRFLHYVSILIFKYFVFNLRYSLASGFMFFK